MKVFVPECVRQFCLCVFDKREYYIYIYIYFFFLRPFYFCPLSSFLSSLICFIRNQN